mgnify:CR=1 FL=1
MAFFKKPQPQYVAPVVEEKPAEPVLEEKEPEKKPDVFVPMYQTKIGKGITFYGDFESQDPIELNGSIHGNIDSTDMVSISETGSYYGEAKMHELHVDGIVEGTILCEDLAAFTGTSRMDGKLTTARLRTDDGSGMTADLKIQPAEKKTTPVAPAPAEMSPEATAPDLSALAEEGDVPVTEEDLFR